MPNNIYCFQIFLLKKDTYRRNGEFNRGITRKDNPQAHTHHEPNPLIPFHDVPPPQE
ncbi:MAG: hypothetical protein U0518_05930 [Candidatus Gracilibacteria bacterium]